MTIQNAGFRMGKFSLGELVVYENKHLATVVAFRKGKDRIGEIGINCQNYKFMKDIFGLKESKYMLRGAEGTMWVKSNELTKLNLIDLAFKDAFDKVAVKLIYVNDKFIDDLIEDSRKYAGYKVTAHLSGALCFPTIDNAEFDEDIILIDKHRVNELKRIINKLNKEVSLKYSDLPSRLDKGGVFWYVDLFTNSIKTRIEAYDETSNRLFSLGNYFTSKDLALRYLNQFLEILKDKI